MSRRLYWVVSLWREVHRTKQSQEEPHHPVAKPLWGTNYKPNSPWNPQELPICLSSEYRESVLTSYMEPNKKSAKFVCHTRKFHVPRVSEWVHTHLHLESLHGNQWRKHKEMAWENQRGPKHLRGPICSHTQEAHVWVIYLVTSWSTQEEIRN
jgi:hypothetical protein